MDGVISPSQLGLFAAASLALILVPGPSVVFILSATLRHGRAVGLATTAGIEVSYFGHVAGTVLGVSAVVAASAEAFTVVKLAGGLYLLFLAARSWRSRAAGTLEDLAEAPHPAPSLRGAFLRALPVGLLNPKTAIFYLAFLPQFVRDGGGPVPLQLAVLGVVFILLAALCDSMWAIGGGRLRRVAPRLRVRIVDRVSGSVMAVLAAVTLTARRAT